MRSRTGNYLDFCAAVRAERGGRCQCCGRTAEQALQKMTCIVRDVLRLTDLVFPSASPSTSHDDTDEGGASDAGSDARQLAELLK